VRWLVVCAALAACRADPPANLVAVSLPDGEAGIGFDDLQYSLELKRVIAPAGRSGHVALVDPTTLMVTTVDGFSSGIFWVGGHDEGATSADFGNGHLFVTDRSTDELVIADTKGEIVGRAALGAHPDYVRYIAPNDEVWVTEPPVQRIEVFSVADPDHPKAIGTIPVPDGPESLIVDLARIRAYTFTFGGLIVVIELASKMAVAGWPNGCTSSRGLGLDGAAGRLFAACDEGRVTVTDIAHAGAPLGSVEVPQGVDVIGWSSSLGHLYAPSGGSLSVIAVDGVGAPRLLRSVPAVSGSHCATADDQGNAWICDPENGRLLMYQDMP
jgi:hypothetical protein